MRTLFWCGCAIAVTVASLVYLAADYAHEYPSSTVGRCVLLAYQVGCQYNPISLISQATYRHAPVKREHSEAEQAGKCAAAAAVEAVEQGLGEDAMPPERRPCEVIDLTRFEIVDPPQDRIQKDVVEKDFEIPLDPPVCQPRCTSDGMTWSVPPGVIKERDDELQTLPPSIEEESEVPASMPAAEDKSKEASTEAFEEFLMGLFYETAEPIPAPQVEESIDTPDDEPVDSEEKVEPKTEEGVEPKIEGGEEESEAIHGGTAPEMREDPSYHHQYPGCPYMGGCPRSSCSPAPEAAPKTNYYRPSPEDPCSPAPEAAPPAAPKKHKKKKVKSAEPTSTEKPAAPMDDPEVDEECPKHADVDTTEFRKSDAHKGEFARHPF